MVKDSSNRRSCDIPVGGCQCRVCGYPKAYAWEEDIDAALEMEEAYINGTAMTIQAHSSLLGQGRLIVDYGGYFTCEQTPAYSKSYPIRASITPNVETKVEEKFDGLTAAECLERFVLRQRDQGEPLTEIQLRIGREQWTAQLRKVTK